MYDQDWDEKLKENEESNSLKIVLFSVLGISLGIALCILSVPPSKPKPKVNPPLATGVVSASINKPCGSGEIKVINNSLESDVLYLFHSSLRERKYGSLQSAVILIPMMNVCMRQRAINASREVLAVIEHEQKEVKRGLYDDVESTRVYNKRFKNRINRTLERYERNLKELKEKGVACKGIDSF